MTLTAPLVAAALGITRQHAWSLLRDLEAKSPELVKRDDKGNRTIAGEHLSIIANRVRAPIDPRIEKKLDEIREALREQDARINGLSRDISRLRSSAR